MYKLFTDKHENFKCNIGVEGASINNTSARIILESDLMNLVFEGSVKSDGSCTIPIKKLKGFLSEGTKGTMKLEVIADDTFFSPWQDDFNVVVNKKVTVEVAGNNNYIKESTINVKVTSGNSKPTRPTKKRIVEKISHANRLVNLLEKKGVTLDNVSTHMDRVERIVESYIRKTKIKEPVADLIDEIIFNLK